MSGAEIFNLIGGIISILSFLFAVWVWMRSDIKIKELIGVIRSVHQITSTAIWESVVSPAKDYDSRLKQAEKNVGFLESIQKLTEEYAGGESKPFHDRNLRILLDKYVLWTTSMLDDYESGKNLTEVWVVTKDLKPDSTDEETGKLVNRNLKKGVKYVFFFPDSMTHLEAEKNRLLKNVNATASKLRNQIKFVSLSQNKYAELVTDGNIVLYFHDKNRNLIPKCFEEIVFTQIRERGIFWQEHADDESNRLKYLLELELNEQPNA